MASVAGLIICLGLRFCLGAEVQIRSNIPKCVYSDEPFNISCYIGDVFSAVVAILDASNLDVIKCNPAENDDQKVQLEGAFKDTNFVAVRGCRAAGQTKNGVNVIFSFASGLQSMNGEYACRLGYTNNTGTWSQAGEHQELKLCDTPWILIIVLCTVGGLLIILGVVVFVLYKKCLPFRIYAQSLCACKSKGMQLQHKQQQSLEACEPLNASKPASAAKDSKGTPAKKVKT